MEIPFEGHLFRKKFKYGVLTEYLESGFSPAGILSNEEFILVDSG